jgi:hypothetical protein
MEIKKPKTPVESKLNQRKNSFVSGSIFHEVNTPVATIMDERQSIATETPSTPTEKPIFKGLYHITDDVNSIGSVIPAFRAAMNFITKMVDKVNSATLPVTITPST